MGESQTELTDCVRINDAICIPDRELDFSFSRGSGPGGQHVNKTETTVEVRWQPATSVALTDHARTVLLRNLSTRLDADGWLRIEASTERSQLRNRDEALRKLAQALREALVVAKPRRATRPTRASKERRLEAKRRDSTVKKHRRVDVD